MGSTNTVPGGKVAEEEEEEEEEVEERRAGETEVGESNREGRELEGKGREDREPKAGNVAEIKLTGFAWVSGCANGLSQSKKPVSGKEVVAVVVLVVVAVGMTGKEGVKEGEGEKEVLSALVSLLGCCVIASEKRSRGESLLAVALLVLSSPSNIPNKSS